MRTLEEIEVDATTYTRLRAGQAWPDDAVALVREAYEAGKATEEARAMSHLGAYHHAHAVAEGYKQEIARLRKESCWACNGTGQGRYIISGEQDCRECNGTGRNS